MACRASSSSSLVLSSNSLLFPYSLYHELTALLPPPTTSSEPSRHGDVVPHHEFSSVLVSLFAALLLKYTGSNEGEFNVRVGVNCCDSGKVLTTPVRLSIRFTLTASQSLATLLRMCHSQLAPNQWASLTAASDDSQFEYTLEQFSEEATQQAAGSNSTVLPLLSLTVIAASSSISAAFTSASKSNGSSAAPSSAHRILEVISAGSPRSPAAMSFRSSYTPARDAPSTPKTRPVAISTPAASRNAPPSKVLQDGIPEPFPSSNDELELVVSSPPTKPESIPTYFDIHTTFQYPPLATVGQADYRTRCFSHLSFLISSLVQALPVSPPTGEAATTPFNLGIGELSLADVSIIDQKERDQLLIDWSGVKIFDTVPTTPTMLHELFELTADEHRNRIALIEGKKTMTYEEVDIASTRLAQWLRGQGVTTGSFVGMFLPRSMDVYITLLGILKSGAAYVPIDPEYPPDRVSYILTDIEAKVVVTHSSLVTDELILPESIKKILVDTEAAKQELQNCSSKRLTREDTAADNTCCAYVIYTSGSTGRPKGVMLEHRSVVNLVRAERVIFNVQPTDRVWQGFSIAFDASVEEVWLAFHSGAALFCATHEIIHSGPALVQILVDNQITVMSTVPTLLTMFDQDIPSIRILILGGEACMKDLVLRWAKPPRVLCNSYGPTEATVIGTYAWCNADAPIVTIGTPVPSYFCFILDPNCNPVPVGVAGELHIGGIGVARGYVKRDDLTKEKFISLPWHKLATNSPAVDELIMKNSPRLYKTGDLARWTEGGEIEFCGRIDAQVKLRGFRVELAEIESVMMQCEGILSAVVTVQTEEELGMTMQQLVGFVILKAGVSSVDEHKLRDQMRVRLAAYMIPSIIKILDSFPTLPSGKVDRKKLPKVKATPALPAPVSGDSTANGSSTEHAGELDVDSPDGSYIAPKSPTEKKIAGLWRQAFQLTKVSLTDDFFSLGGHSVLAAWLVSALRADPLTAHASVMDVYNNTTLEKLAKRLQDTDPNTEVDEEEVADASEMKVAGAVGGSNGISLQPITVGGMDSANMNEADFTLTATQLAKKQAFMAAPNWKVAVCSIFQLLSLYIIVAFPAIQLTLPWELILQVRVVEVTTRQGNEIFHNKQTAPLDFVDQFLWAIIAAVCVVPALLIVLILIKWILIGRYKEGRYPLFGSFYFRHWLLTRIQAVTPLLYLRGSVFMPWFARMMGAKVGQHVFFHTTAVEAWDLVTIDDDASLGIDCRVANVSIEGGYLVLRKVHIGARAFVGTACVLSPGSVMEDDSSLAAMSLLAENKIIPQGELWRGSPAMRYEKPHSETEWLKRESTAVAKRADELQKPTRSEPKSATLAVPGAGARGSTFGAQLRQRPSARPTQINGSINYIDKFLLSGKPELAKSRASTKLSPVREEYESKEHKSGNLDIRVQLNTNGVDSSDYTGDQPNGKVETSNVTAAVTVTDGGGILSQAIAHGPDGLPILPYPSRIRLFFLYFGTFVGLSFCPLFILISSLPGLFLLHVLVPSEPLTALSDDPKITSQDPNFLRDSGTLVFLVVALPNAVCYTVLNCLQLLVYKWLLLGRVKPGNYSIYSFFYLRKWIVDNLMCISLSTIHTVYATLYLNPWYRAMGAKLGAEVEISTAAYTSPDLLEIGEKSFIADSVALGVPTYHRGMMRLGKCKIGARSFIGNNSVILNDSEVGDNVLVGVLSTAPVPPNGGILGDPALKGWPESRCNVPNDTSWLGSPAMFLPQRAKAAGNFDEASTYRPSKCMYVTRLTIEFFRITLPYMLFGTLFLLVIARGNVFQFDTMGQIVFWLTLPLYWIGLGAVCCVVVLILKWLLVGRYKKCEHPLWSSFVWRTEFITGILESLAHDWLMDYLLGTQWLCIWFRMLGAKIGSRVILDTSQITEPDLIEIGNDSVIGSHSDLQTHLFEDRVMKCDYVRVGERCVIGASSVVLYNTRMKEGSSIGDLSLLMKGEELERWTSWEGIPAQLVRSRGKKRK